MAIFFNFYNFYTEEEFKKKTSHCAMIDEPQIESAASMFLISKCTTDWQF